MIIPFMISQLIFIPKIISLLVLGGLILASIVEFRQGHIGKIAIAGNAFLLWQIFFSNWGGLPIWFQWYLNIGTILAVIAIPSYLFKKSLPTWFYQGAFILYGSISVIITVVIAILLKIPLW